MKHAQPEQVKLCPTIHTSLEQLEPGDLPFRLTAFEEQITRIDAVTGLARRGVEIVLAELGTDMSQFPDAAHAASWVGMCPGSYECGGKQLTRPGGRTAI